MLLLLFFLPMALAVLLPEHLVPLSDQTVEVFMINTTAEMLGLETQGFFGPSIKGHDWLATSNYAFLVRNTAQNRSILFDLGMRKDFENAPPLVTDAMAAGGYQLAVHKDVRQILGDHGVPGTDVEAVVWSHHHPDHTGDPSRFGPSTALVVGPGFRSNVLPGYPAKRLSPILESDYEGRELRELAFTDASPRVGRFWAFDYFGDGSFYLLDAPGHAAGHLCGFARVTTSPDSFILLGGDAAHHAGELRPTRRLPLPEQILPNPFTLSPDVPCPGHLFEPLLPRGRTRPFYTPVPHGHDPAYDGRETVRTIEKIQELDGYENVLVALTHDEALGSLSFFPESMNNFVERGWVNQITWAFLRDFTRAVGWEGGETDKEDGEAPE